MSALYAFTGITLHARGAARCTAEEAAAVVHSAVALVAGMDAIVARSAEDAGGAHVQHVSCAVCARAAACAAQRNAYSAACCAMHALLRTQPGLVAAPQHAAVVASVALRALQPAATGAAACACAACDAVQAAACALLAQLAAACGGGEALQRIMAARASNDDDDDDDDNDEDESDDDDVAMSHPRRMLPIAALLTACMAQQGKPALRREAARALALLLALQHAAAEAQ
jgi:hypothetical protein